MIDALVTRHDPRCIGWACAYAALYGIADDNDLDEAVVLTVPEAVRLRYKPGHGREIMIDRPSLTLRTIRPGHHVTLRFYFKSGRFFETEVRGFSNIITADIQTVEITSPCG